MKKLSLLVVSGTGKGVPNFDYFSADLFLFAILSEMVESMSRSALLSFGVSEIPFDFVSLSNIS